MVNVRVRITGGLGNQLFKFFHGYKLAQHFNVDLTLDTSWYKSQNLRNSKVSVRKFDLNFFPEIGNFKVHNSNFVFGDRWLELIERRLGSSFQKLLDVYSESNIWDKTSPPRVIYGNFEKLNYLPDPQIICKFLISPSTSSPKFKSISEILCRDEVAVLHIRRGDYLNLPDIYDVLDKNYYSAGLKNIESIQKLSNLIVFTDTENLQLPWLKEISSNYQIIGPESNFSSAETMLLMSHSKNLICANSTFSWWAAYLGTITYRTKNVVIPSRFNKIPGGNYTKDLFLNDWICITPEGKHHIPSNFA